VRTDEKSTAGVSRFGRVMIIAAWLLMLFMLTLLFNGYLTRQENPNGMPEGESGSAGVREVTLLRNRAGHYVVDGTINGHPVTFLLDTGATDVAVPVAVARRLGLRPGLSSVSQTANGAVTTWNTRLDEVRLGPIRMCDVRASILPGDAGGKVLLGMSFLKHLELLQRGRTLTLRQY